ncbi:MAG: alpha-ketoglutarate-dependent dioxygenase AlkB [Ignavibacterium sp.]|nr:MAG: alpha-ketoglutarate-dependent dioxygenase AlkB [Ignavibacterium sp.]
MFGINGLLYLPNYLTQVEENQLTKWINKQNWDNTLKRRVQHYGYRYDYKARTVTSDMYLGTLPKWLNNLAIKLKEDGLSEEVPDQVIINEYQPGQGISAHIDCESCFGPRIFSLSLGSAAIMEFTLEGKPKKEILLDRRSLVMMYGAARSIWKHSIPARLKDKGIERGTRISLTFRNVEKDF